MENFISRRVGADLAARINASLSATPVARYAVAGVTSATLLCRSRAPRKHQSSAVSRYNVSKTRRCSAVAFPGRRKYLSYSICTSQLSHRDTDVATALQVAWGVSARQDMRESLINDEPDEDFINNRHDERAARRGISEHISQSILVFENTA